MGWRLAKILFDLTIDIIELVGRGLDYLDEPVRRWNGRGFDR